MMTMQVAHEVARWRARPDNAAVQCAWVHRHFHQESTDRYVPSGQYTRHIAPGTLHWPLHCTQFCCTDRHNVPTVVLNWPLHQALSGRCTRHTNWWPPLS